MKIAARDLVLGDVVGSGEVVLFCSPNCKTKTSKVWLERNKNGVVTQRVAEWNSNTMIGVSSRTLKVEIINGATYRHSTKN